ncbi:MAG: sodium-dependent transporter [Halieaceae bacterium]
MVNRGEFGSRLGFILAAAGSAVGLGNIWGFPTQAASNGGAAFLLVYLVLAFALAYPILMAELILGRHAHGNSVVALTRIAERPVTKAIGALTGLAGILVASSILSFYSIVSGWMLGFTASYPLAAMGFDAHAAWLTDFSLSRNVILMTLFSAMTIGIVMGGVQGGIERWSRRLMPTLIVTLIVLAAYVLSLEGAGEGLRVYLVPDFSKILSADLILRALGSAFFSLSLGVGTMLIYGSYISDEEHLPSIGVQVALIDVGIAVLAGFLILPAMYVALARGVEIFDATGALLSEDTLIFTVLPELFATLGTAGLVLATAFFFLMSVAALTSSISMLEVPVAFLTERFQWTRSRAAIIAGVFIGFLSTAIAMNFDSLFGFVIAASTRYGQPMLGLMLCIYTGWIWRRDNVLAELKKNDPDVASGVFWKIWPWYLRIVCPVVIGFILWRSLL